MRQSSIFQMKEYCRVFCQWASQCRPPLALSDRWIAEKHITNLRKRNFIISRQCTDPLHRCTVNVFDKYIYLLGSSISLSKGVFCNAASALQYGLEAICLRIRFGAP
jgi:hypothetical protein